MVFFPFIFVAIYLYARGTKTLALLIFFFLIMSGFNLIPETMFDLGVGISKGSDLAFFILLGCLVLDGICIKGFFRMDSYTKWLLAFYVFLLVCVAYSKFVIHLPWTDIIKTSRFYFFFMAYFIFRNMEMDELEKLLKYLFLVTVGLASLFLLQVLLGTEILNSSGFSFFELGDFKFKRFYNHPFTLNFMALLAIYKNPLKGLPRLVTMAILVLALLGGFHRSLTGAFCLVLIVGYIIQLPHSRKVKVFIISLSLLVPTVVFFGHRFLNSRAYLDMVSVTEGNFAELEWETIASFQESTFAFRMGILFEKIIYLSENPVAQVLGAGLMTEYSSQANKQFDFVVGLTDGSTDSAVQIETSDISYPPLLLRTGYVGTALFLMLYIYIMVYCYKRSSNKYALSSFLFILLSLLISFFSSNLLTPVTFLLPLLTFNIVQKQYAKQSGESPS